MNEPGTTSRGDTLSMLNPALAHGMAHHGERQAHEEDTDKKASRRRCNKWQVRGLPNRAGMNEPATTSRGDTSSMLKPARLRTERRIMESARRMKGRGMGSFCSSHSSTIRSRSREKGLSSTCEAF